MRKNPPVAAHPRQSQRVGRVGGGGGRAKGRGGHGTSVEDGPVPEVGAGAFLRSEGTLNLLRSQKLLVVSCGGDYAAPPVQSAVF